MGAIVAAVPPMSIRTGMALVERLEQVEVAPPAGVVFVHGQFLADDALLALDALRRRCGSPSMVSSRVLQVLLEATRAREEVARVGEGRECVGARPPRGVEIEDVPRFGLWNILCSRKWAMPSGSGVPSGRCRVEAAKARGHHAVAASGEAAAWARPRARCRSARLRAVAPSRPGDAAPAGARSAQPSRGRAAPSSRCSSRCSSRLLRAAGRRSCRVR